MNIFDFVLARLKEPSSYAGAGALFAAAGIHVNDAVLQAAIQVLVSLAGLAAVLLPEKIRST
ncbi:MAG: hypothetical protein ACREE9_00625 [Stellaceae bacterium]